MRSTITPVDAMFVNCSLRVRNFDSAGIAMSDCCRAHATSFVVMSNGSKMWRCETHRGVRSFEPGPVGTMIVTNADDPSVVYETI